MPGYKALPAHFGGRVAEGVRFAEILQRAGANDDAADLLEHTLELCIASSPEIPGWLCGRLATLYRTLKRYEDEVRLLERYRDSHQTSDEAHSRFDARLSKAHAIAERNQRTDSRAHASVRTVIARGTTEMPVPAAAAEELDAARGTSDFTPEAMRMLRDAFVALPTDEEDQRLALALLRMRDEARIQRHPPERMVTTLRDVWRRSASPPGVDAATWRVFYRKALTRLLAMYFDESET